MNTRTFALIWGILFLVAGLGGFVPGILQSGTPDPDLSMTHGYGHVLGMWPVNTLHNLVHVIFGVWGILASRGSFGGARNYARIVAIVYALFIVMGLVDGLDTTFGLVPLYGGDVWLHALLALPAAYFGFMHRDNDAAHRS
jgi:hypothetical protein